MPVISPPAVTADITKAELPAAERRAVDAADPRGLKAADAAWQEFTVLLKGSPWSEQASYNRLNALCEGGRNGFDASQPWDGVRERTPFKNPEFQKRLLADTELLNRTIKMAVDGKGEGHFVAADVLQELLRGVMRDDLAQRYSFGAPQLGLQPGKALETLMLLTAKISGYVRYGPDGKMEQTSAELALTRLGYDEWAVDGRVRSEIMRKTGDFSLFSTTLVRLREDLAKAAADHLSRRMETPLAAAAEKEVLPAINLLRALRGFNTGAYPSLVDVIEKGSKDQAKAAATVLAEGGVLNAPEYRRLRGIASANRNHPNHGVAEKLLAKVAAPKDEEIASLTTASR